MLSLDKVTGLLLVAREGAIQVTPKSDNSGQEDENFSVCLGKTLGGELILCSFRGSNQWKARVSDVSLYSPPFFFFFFFFFFSLWLSVCVVNAHAASAIICLITLNLPIPINNPIRFSNMAERPVLSTKMAAIADMTPEQQRAIFDKSQQSYQASRGHRSVARRTRYD